MKLKNINEIKENGLTVFMPSGIQATLFNEGENIIVKYSNLTEDKYTINEFKNLITEGIEIFNDLATGNQIIESLSKKGYIRNSLKEEYLKEEYKIGTVVGLDDGSVHTIDSVNHDGNIIIYRDDEGYEFTQSRINNVLQDAPYDENEEPEYPEYTIEYCIYLKDGTEEWFENKDSADAYFEEHEDEVDDYFSKEYDQYGNEGDVIIIYRASDINESDENLDDLSIESSLRKSASEEEDAIASYLKRAKKAEKHDNIELANLYKELADDEKVHSVQIRTVLDKYNMNNTELENKGKEEAEELLGEADENGENTLESFLGIKEQDFKTKKDLIKYIEDKTDYNVVNSDNLIIVIKDKNNSDAEEIALNLKQEIKEGYNQKDCKPGSIFTALKNKKKEYLTQEFKLELLQILDRIAREYPDVRIRKQAIEYMDEVGLQEYYDTNRIIKFAQDNIKILNKHVVESVDEDLHSTDTYINKDDLSGEVYDILYGYGELSDNEVIIFNTNFQDMIKTLINEKDSAMIKSIKGDIGNDTFNNLMDGSINALIIEDKGEKSLDESMFDDKCAVIKEILGDEYELESVNYGKQAGYKQINYSPKGEKFTYSVDGKDWNEAIANLKTKIKSKNETINKSEESVREENGKIICTIYGKDKEFDTKEDAIKYFELGYNNCDPNSSEASRYVNVLTMLNEQDKNESLNEGMWASPFTVENAEKVAELLSEPITFAELVSEEGQQKLWNIIGDDSFWDGAESMALDFPENDARGWIANKLEDWIAVKDNFKKDAYSKKAEDIITNAITNIQENFKVSEEKHNYIVCKGQKVELVGNGEWVDIDTFYLRLPENELLTDDDNTKFFLNCEYQADLDRYAIDAVFVDEEENVVETLPLDKQNSYLTMNDKELIMAFMKKLMADKINETMNETTKPFEIIANDLQNGKKEGFEPIEYGNWKCSVSLDDKWETFTEPIKAYILNEIGFQVNIGDLEFDDLEISIDYDDCENAGMDDSDIESLDIFDDEEITDMMNAEFKPLTFLISYKIEFDKKINEDLKMKKSNKKALKESKLKEEYGEYQGVLDEVANDIENYNNSNEGSFEAEGFSYEWGPLTINGQTWDELELESPLAKEWIRHEIAMPIKDGHDCYYGLDCILVLGESELKDYYLDEECAAKDDFIADMVKLGCEEEKLIDAINYIKENGDKDRSDCKEVEWWIDYDINLKEVDTEEWYIVNCDGERVSDYFDEEEEAQDECDQMNDSEYTQDKPYEVRSTVDEQFKLKDKKKKKKKLDEKDKVKVGNMKKVNEDAYKVYNTIEDRECGTFNSWNDVENFLNQEWGSYAADKAKENPNFGSEEDKLNFFGNYDLVQVPVAVTVEEPVENCGLCVLDSENCDSCEDIEIPNTAEPVEVCPECDEETVNKDIEQALNSDEYVQVDGVTANPEKVDTIVQTNVLTPAETEVLNNLETGEKVLLPNEQPDNAENWVTDGATEFIKAAIDDKSGNKEEVVSTETEEQSLDDFITLVLSDEDEETVADNDDVEETVEETDKNEDFKDNMGMLTNIQDTDFPDALKDAVDTKEDGTLYRISDIAKEVEELKANLKQELENIKNDIKTALTDIKQDIKDNVKDIQIDVTSKLDNTNSKIADLTSEEGLDDEDLELEEEPTEESTEETTDETEEVVEDMAEKRKYWMSNPMYEKIKEVIKSSELPNKKMSVNTISEKLREDYGIKTNINIYHDNVISICECTPIKKYIIDESEEKAMLEENKISGFKKFMRKGLQDQWAKLKEEENLSNLSFIKNQTSENLEQAKKAVDKFANQDGNASKIKKAIELTTDNDQEKEQAIEYAVDKIDESIVTSKLMKAKSGGILSGLASTTVDINRMNSRRK